MSPPRRRSQGRRGRGSKLKRLRGQELLDPEAAELSPVTGLLVAAERGQRVEGPAVYLHLAGADPQRNRLGAFLVARPDATGQAVLAVVGDPDRVVFIRVGLDREHRAEDLLLGDRHLRRNLREDRRADEESAFQTVWRLAAAGEELCALCLSLLDIAAHAPS